MRSNMGKEKRRICGAVWEFGHFKPGKRESGKIKKMRKSGERGGEGACAHSGTRPEGAWEGREEYLTAGDESEEQSHSTALRSLRALFPCG